MKAVNDKTVKAAKKSAAAKTAKKADGKDTERESLTKELRSLIPQLDAEGLAFLVEQARVHLYNMQVEELNKAAEAADAAVARSNSLAGRANKSPKENFSIKGTESGSSYYIHYRNDEVMFSRDEMIRLVKIAGGKGTDIEIRERLYNWFDRERKDVFSVIPIADKFDSRLKTLAGILKKSFRVRND